MSRIKGSKGHPRTPEAIEKFRATLARKKAERLAVAGMERKLAAGIPLRRKRQAPTEHSLVSQKLATVNRLLALMEKILESDNAPKP